jgi:hypothetical protein
MSVTPVRNPTFVTLSDGSVRDAVVSSGYWLAWWPGENGPASVTALDASGSILSDTPFTETDL